MYSRVNVFTHEQTTASDTWVIVHNLGTVKAPIVDCWIDIAGDVVKIIPNMVEFVNVNSCTVHFTSVQTGTAVIA